MGMKRIIERERERAHLPNKDGDNSIRTPTTKVAQAINQPCTCVALNIMNRPPTRTYGIDDGGE